MNIRTASKGKKVPPKLTIEFESDFEQKQFIEFAENVDFDGLNFFANITGYPIFGIDSQVFEEFIEAYQDTNTVGITGAQGEPFAVWWNIDEIKTDSKRFQNRQNAFSELSAEQVAQNYDENKFDPIIIWRDNENNKLYVLSGHSRYEGMRRRGEAYIPVRFFTGSQAEAIKFARIDANRIANKENLVEDLTAYILSRDGNKEKNIQPLTKAELKQAFKGKEQKLEYLSYLDPKGKFIEVLGDDDAISQYPRVQSFATWAGKLRKEQSKITDLMEQDIFNYFFHSDRLRKQNFEKFRLNVLERLSFGKDRIFPECDEIPCKHIKDFKEVGANKDLYKELASLNNLLIELEARKNTNNVVQKIYTDDEKKALLSIKSNIQNTIKRLQRDLNILETTPALFGLPKTQTLLRMAIEALNLVD